MPYRFVCPPFVHVYLPLGFRSVVSSFRMHCCYAPVEVLFCDEMITCHRDSRLQDALEPGHEHEVKNTELVEWDTAVDVFKATATKKPAFGYAHEMMVQWVDLCLERMIVEYIRPIANAYVRTRRARS